MVSKDENTKPSDVVAPIGTPLIPVAVVDAPLHVPHKPVLSTDAVAKDTPVITGTLPEHSIEDMIVLKEREMKEAGEELVKLEEESKNLFSERQHLEERMAPILEDEKSSIARINLLEEKKTSVSDPHEARLAETGRWAEEENRRGIEGRKWQVSEAREQVAQKIKTIEQKFNALKLKEASAAHAIEGLRIALAQRDLSLELEKLTGEKTATEASVKQFQDEYDRLRLRLRELEKRENDALLAERAVDEKTDSVSSLKDEQQFALERRQLEDARKSVEQERWSTEDAIPPASQSVAKGEAELVAIKKREADLLEKLNALAHLAELSKSKSSETF